MVTPKTAADRARDLVDSAWRETSRLPIQDNLTNRIASEFSSYERRVEDIMRAVRHDDEVTHGLYNRIAKLEKKLETANDAMNFVMDFCKCERFKTPGFDYGEKHSRQGKVKVGARWITPKDKVRAALAAIEGQSAKGKK